VARLELALDVARETLGLFARVDLALAEAARRQREIDARLAHGLVEIERRRRAIVIGNVERRAVREHAARARDRDLADAEQGAIELELREAPAVRRERTAARLDVRLEITVMLLKVLRPEKQPFGPDDFVIPRHPCS